MLPGLFAGLVVCTSDGPTNKSKNGGDCHKLRNMVSLEREYQRCLWDEKTQPKDGNMRTRGKRKGITMRVDVAGHHSDNSELGGAWHPDLMKKKTGALKSVSRPKFEGSNSGNSNKGSAVRVGEDGAVQTKGANLGYEHSGKSIFDGRGESCDVQISRRGPRGEPLRETNGGKV